MENPELPQSLPQRYCARINIMKDCGRTHFAAGHLGGYAIGGDSLTWYPRLWRWLAKTNKSVLDIGCGEGHSTRFFYELGCDVLGVDGCKQALIDSAIPQKVVLHDFCDGSFFPKKRFDLAWCCEFVEHVEEKFADNYLATFGFANMVAMTHAKPGQEGHHHVNCKDSEYWIKKLGEKGWTFQPFLTLKARLLAKKGFFAETGLVFTKEKRIKKLPALETIALRFLQKTRNAGFPEWKMK